MKRVRYFIEDHLVKPFPVPQKRINAIRHYAYLGTHREF